MHYIHISPKYTSGCTLSSGAEAFDIVAPKDDDQRTNDSGVERRPKTEKGGDEAAKKEEEGSKGWDGETTGRPWPAVLQGPMMRIVVAGGGGFGYLLAMQLSQAAHAVVVLSRQARHEFAQLDVQLHVVDYDDAGRLAFALQGVDMVISTISGQEQINLIQAAVRGRVRVFVPSEFEGSLSRRPSLTYDGADASGLDRGSAAALELLQQWAQQSRIRYTVFSCGLLMERFHPCGLSYLNIGRGSGIANAGDYLVDINRATAEYAERDARGRSVRVCLSSVYDVVRFIVAAVDLGTEKWPVEFTMRGDRMTVSELVDTCSRVRNGSPHLLLAFAPASWFVEERKRRGGERES